MAEIRLHANRVLRHRVLSDGTRRGIDGYFSLLHNERPHWFRRMDYPDSALGVFENVSGSDKDALVFDAVGITVCSRPERRLNYADVAALVPPRKIPIPELIECRMQDGSIFCVPVHRREGQVMDIYRFLLAAVREVRRER